MARNTPFIRRGFLAILALALSAGLLLLAIQIIRLDSEVQRLFAGVRWVLPAQVYAAPLDLYPGARLSAAELRHELDRLGYRVAPRLAGPGTYVASGDNSLDVDVRPFAFWDGPQPESRLHIAASADAITAITDADSRQPRDLARLDPLLIGSIYPSHGGEDRVLVKLSDVPPMLVQTLLQVEDRDFYHHIGISFRGIARAIWVDLRAGRRKEGASTITQQLVRNFFLNSEQKFTRKLREQAMAVLLERHVSKNEILEAYLNEVYLGQDGAREVHGFGLASHFYFNKPLDELQPQEIAMLVGVVKGPTEFNPHRNPRKVLERRDLILHMMADAGYITPDELKKALAAPLGVVGGGGAVRYPAFVDLVKRELKGEYREEDLTGEGLRIFTTLSPRAQEALEHHIADDLPELEKARHLKPDTLQASGLITSVGDGEVLALVGGRDLRFAGFNRALDAQRPIGSLAKPFLYLTALEQSDRYTLQTILHDEPVDLKLPNGDTWSPHNYDKQLHGDVPLYIALAKSYNLPTVHLGLDIGVDKVRKTFADAGFADAPALPSMFLGAIDMSPMDVAEIYSTLAGSGYRTPLLAIHEVLTRDGQPLQRYRFQVKQVLPEGPVYLTTWAMEQVIALGTARWANTVLPAGQVFAGKTGTTEDLRDSWFAGFGSDRVAVVWVGRDDNQPTGFDGAGAALRIWGHVMHDLRAKGIDTPAPPDIEPYLVDPGTGLLADAACPESISIPYLKGSNPTQYAPCASAAKSGPVDWLKSIFK